MRLFRTVEKSKKVFSGEAVGGSVVSRLGRMTCNFAGLVWMSFSEVGYGFRSLSIKHWSAPPDQHSRCQFHQAVRAEPVDSIRAIVCEMFTRQ